MKSIRIFFIIAIVMILCATVLDSMAQTKWYKYPGSLIFEGGSTEKWDHHLLARTVLFENDQYHMWYTGRPKDSPDRNYIGYATSDDGINWTKYENNPLVFSCDGESWDTYYFFSSIIKHDSGFYMWYSGVQRNDAQSCSIGFAWSSDGLSWKKHPEPVLINEKEKKWDSYMYLGPSVIYDGQLFHMWYSGLAETYPNYIQIGYASSKDGINWQKHPENPVLEVGEPGSWDDNQIFTQSVIFNGSHYEMWYTGYDNIQYHIGHAQSVDGVHWTKSSGNPVLRAGDLGMWDSDGIVWPTVVQADSIYRLWYMAFDFVAKARLFGYATTSANEAKAWKTLSGKKPQRIFRVQVFGRVEYINVDSLTLLIDELSGTDRIDVYNKLALAYSLNNDELSFTYAEKALALSEQENYPEGKAFAYYSIGNCQYVLDNYSNALSNQLKALWLFDSLEMFYEEGNLLSQIASIHSYTGSHDLASEYHHRASEIFQKLDNTELVFHTLEYLGDALLEAGDTSNAIKIFKKRHSLACEVKDLYQQGYSYELISRTFRGKEYDSAVYYVDKAFQTWDTLVHGRIGFNHFNRAETYFSFGLDYFNDAEIYYLKILWDYRESHERIKIYYKLAVINLSNGNYTKTGEYLKMSQELCQNHLNKHCHQIYPSLNLKLKNEIILKSYMEKIYWLYYRFYKESNNMASAFEYYKLAMQSQASIYDQQSRRQIAMIQGNYEVESSRNRITILEKENEVKTLTIKQRELYIFALGGLLGIIILIAILFFRQNQIRSENKSLALEQKLFRLQMNPHFIFNALSNIQNFIDRQEMKRATEYLTSFSHLLRFTLKSTREDYIYLDEEIASLKHYLNLQSLRYVDKFDYSFEIDHHIDPENTLIPPMLLQPIVENSIEHGIAHKTDKGNISLRFNLTNNTLVCEIEDNGVGRIIAMEIESTAPKYYQSMATEIIKDRIQVINKKLKQKISFNIIDLYSEIDQPAGTKVLMELPYLKE